MGTGDRKSLTVAGVLLHYIEFSSGSPATDPPLLVLHQLLATAETLTGIIQHLPADRRIIALDILSAQPSFGPLDLRSELLANLIQQFLATVGMHRPIVIGHSHGGNLGLWLAAKGYISALALLCPAHPYGGYRSKVVAFYLTRWGRFLALSIPFAPSRAILWAYNEAAGPARSITLRHLKPHLVVLRNRNSLRRVLEILRTWEDDMTSLRYALAANPIQQPTLLLWGEKDVVVPAASAPGLLALLTAPDSRVLPGLGHLLPEEAPALCAGLITGWLDSLKDTDASSVPVIEQLA
jgi:pimeloyl-ACP methyl ester carboxylesterase